MTDDDPLTNSISLRPDGRLVLDARLEVLQRAVRRKRAEGSSLNDIVRWLLSTHGLSMTNKGVWTLMTIGIEDWRSSDPLHPKRLRRPLH